MKRVVVTECNSIDWQNVGVNITGLSCLLWLALSIITMVVDLWRLFV